MVNCPVYGEYSGISLKLDGIVDQLAPGGEGIPVLLRIGSEWIIAVSHDGFGIMMVTLNDQVKDKQLSILDKNGLIAVNND